MHANLVVTEGPERGRVYPIMDGTFVLGRDPACQVRLTDMKVSRQHSQLVADNGTCAIEDLGSSNGTWVNGESIKARPLRDGDLIGIGNTRLHFRVVQKQITGPIVSPSATQRITLVPDGLLMQWQDATDIETLRRAKSDLETLYRLGRTINPILETSQLVPKLLDLIFEEVRKVDRCSVVLLDPDTGAVSATASRFGREIPPDGSPPYSQVMLEQVTRGKKAILLFGAGEGGDVPRSAICAPILIQKSLLGVIYADTFVPEHRFSRDDLRLVAAIALQAGAALANAQLYEHLVFEKNELAAAHQHLKSAQDQLVQSEKLAAVGQLASGVVHDIKNPMSVILGYIGIVREKLLRQCPEQVKALEVDQDLAAAEEGVQHCTGVVDNLLKFARPSKLSKAPVNLNELLQETLKFLHVEIGRAGVALETEFAASLPLLRADGNQLKQVFINILLNAIQAMDKPKPLIRVTTAALPVATPPAVQVTIRDNGKGMTEEDRRRVFDPFFSTKAMGAIGGSGLGLSISYQIIQSHGGSIEASSAHGEGASFLVTLPLGATPG